MRRRYAANSMMDKAIGRISPLIAPARIRTLTGRPTNTNVTVEKTMNPIVTQRCHRSMGRTNVRINDTDVYAAPTTDVMAADHITIPNSL